MAVLSIRSAAVAAVLAAGSLASATVYTDLASFLANTQPGYYFNNFSSVGAGPSGPLAFGPVNGYSYVVDTIGPGNTAPTSGLYNNPGVISTDNATDLIRVTFTGAPVTAVGGNFWGTDINFGAIPTTVTIALSNGDVETFVTNSSTAFRGFTSNVVITSLTIDAADSPGFNWSTMDNLYVGAAVPAPASLALVGLGGLAAIRRRR